MGMMSLQDAVFLLAEARERPMHVGGLQLFRPAPNAGPSHVGELHREAIEHGEIRRRLRRRPVRSLGGIGPWAWEDDPGLDLEYHIRHSALPHPGRIRELLALTSRLHGTLLDRSRPLWEAHLIEGLEDGRFATYTKIHHALVDGVSAIRMLERALSTDPDERGMPPPFAPGRDRGVSGGSSGDGDGGSGGGAAGAIGRAVSGTVGGVTDAVRSVAGAGDAAVRSLVRGFYDHATAVPYRAPRSPLNVQISGARRFAADSWSLERMKSVGQALDATLNDVMLAMCSGALRRYLMDVGGLPDQPLIAMVPVSLRAAGADEDDESGNAVGLILCNLGTHLADPADRFELIRESSSNAKMRLEGLTPTAILLLSALSFAPLGLGPLYRYEPLSKPPFNIIISNVPGPRETLYWNGSELTGTYPLSIPVDGQAMNITASSYAGQMCFGLTGCRRSVPRLQRLLTDLEETLVELEETAGIA